MHLPDLRFGPLRIRWDFILVVVATGVVAGLRRSDLVAGLVHAAALAAAIVVHELGHAAAAAPMRARFEVVLQLTGGSPYLGSLATRRAQGLVLLAGPLTGVLGLVGGTLLVNHFPGQLVAYFGSTFRFFAVVWSVFQLLPFPPLDGGLFLRRVVLARLGSAVLSWRIGWVLGFAAVLLLVSFDVRLLEPAVWLTGMAIILGRAEAGYVRHVDAFEAWERGDHREVIRRVQQVPEYLPTQDARALLELGVAAGIEIEDAAAVEDFAAKLPAAHPSVVLAAEWLLREGRGFGARLAQQAFDALDAERVDRAQLDLDRWADLALQFAIHEAKDLNPASALGLLERAATLGFDSPDRVEAEAAFRGLKDMPRWHAVLDRMRGLDSG